MISTELTRNTTRVVEVAVKNEVQNSVLPSLESITRNEVKTVLNDQLGRGLTDLVSRVSLLLLVSLISANVPVVASSRGDGESVTSPGVFQQTCTDSRVPYQHRY